MQSRFKFLGVNPWMAVSFALGLAQAWRSRFLMTHDGVAYMDIGDAYLRGDWHTAINGYFNPLYAWIHAFARLVFRPSAYWEYPLVHLVNFGIFVVTTFTFEYFLRGLLKNREDDFAIRCVGYSIFLWSSLVLIPVAMIEPDMIVCACVFAAFGMLLRRPDTKPVALGAALAIGYYTKAWMFPLAFMILFAAWKLLPRRGTLIAASTFLILCAPWIVAVSISTGHPTIGDTSRLNYAWYVNHLDMSRFWQGGPPEAGTPVHPAQILLDSPRLYGYGGVFPVTNAIWYDQSYWYRGLRMWFAPRLLARAYFNNSLGLVKFLIGQGGGFLAGWLLCLLLQKDKSLRKDMAPRWAWLVALGALMFLCAVLVEPRYIASLVAILFLVPFTLLSARIGKAIGGAVAIGGFAWALAFSSVSTYKGDPTFAFRYTPQNEAWQLATEMQRLGIQPREELACAGHGGGTPLVFASRLIRARIVAQLDWSVDFWQLSEPDRQRVLTALASTGAKFAVSEESPPDPGQASGWQRIGSSSYYAYPLSALASTSKSSSESAYR
jgi:hypothetical protein